MKNSKNFSLGLNVDKSNATTTTQMHTKDFPAAVKEKD